MRALFQYFLFLVFLFGAAQYGYSCSCFRIDNKSEVDMTDAVFTGKVVEITEDKSYVSPPSENNSTVKIAGMEFPIVTKQPAVKRFLVKFRVDKKFKGAEGGEITLVQYIREFSMCSELVFTKGEKYLVYASKINNELMNRGCTRTQIFDKKSDDYKELREFAKKKQTEKK